MKSERMNVRERDRDEEKGAELVVLKKDHTGTDEDIEKASDHDYHGVRVTNREKVVAALFYGISSIAVIFTNKAVLTKYKFPCFHFLAVLQFAVTCMVLCILISLGKCFVLSKIDRFALFTTY